MTIVADPIIGLQELRRNYLRVSESAFRRIRPTLPVVQLSARRKGVRLSDFHEWLAARTQQPVGTDR